MSLLIVPLLLVVMLVLFSRRYGWWRASVADNHPRILMYHQVREHIPGAKFNKLRVTPAMFERQLRWLSQNGYQFITMSALARPETLPEKAIALTFDDGFADNLIQADPILERYNACATLYLVQDRHDRDWSTSKKAHHNSGELMREPKLDDGQVQQMLASGRWELGGHTCTHANLITLDDEQKWQEIHASKQALEQQFGTRLSSFAYPFGIFDARDVELAEVAGFDTAVTTEEGICQALALQRFTLSRIKMSGKDNWLAFRLRMRTGVRG